MAKKVLAVFTDSEQTAKMLSEMAERYSLKCKVISSVALLSADNQEELLELLLDADREMVKGFRYLLLSSEKPIEVSTDFLLREVPHTLNLEELLDKLIYGVIGDVFYNVKIAFHPILDLKNGKVFACEALCRPPIKITDLLKVGRSTSTYTEEFCRSKAIKEAGEKLNGEIKLFINFHPGFLTDPFRTFGDFISTAVSYNFKPSRIVIELTEHEKLELSSVRGFINFLKEEGVKVALDDVGSGYSGLFYLSELKPDYIKIDMELIRDIHRNNFKKVIVGHLIKMAHSEGIKVVCEGIEKKEELDWVKYAGADYGQGFLFAKPTDKPDTAAVEELAKKLLALDA
ncbi:Blue light- and temperature-regulated antirepressor BluF [bacterium HR13]|nr:Blue light- and temperature-regulated antirepressor BluF [bacterium HR13]